MGVPGTPMAGWFMMGNAIHMDDLGEPLPIQESSIYPYCIYVYNVQT